ncbi:MAG: hypothetical protein R3A52_03435 [Polyangiales bacterium]
MLHAPEPAAPRAPVVLWLSAGQKVRQGAWRMNVVIARRLARRGVPVLRFDFNGFGDSEGDLRDGAMVMDLYGQIQSGGFRDDVAAAARFALAETGARSVVMGGLCGGGISGLFAAPLVRETYGHVLIDLPVTISSAARQAQLESDAAELLRSRPGETDTVIALYLRKALDPEAWRRLLSGRSDYKLITQALKLKARERLDAALPSLPEPWRARVSAALGGVLLRWSPSPRASTSTLARRAHGRDGRGEERARHAGLRLRRRRGAARALREQLVVPPDLHGVLRQRGAAGRRGDVAGARRRAHRGARHQPHLLAAALAAVALRGRRVDGRGGAGGVATDALTARRGGSSAPRRPRRSPRNTPRARRR